MTIRAVFDTNIIISGVFWGGPPRQVLTAIARRKAVMLMSEDLFTELDRVLNYPKFDRHYERSGDTPQLIIARYWAISELVRPTHIPNSGIRDPKDVMVLEAAVGGKADYLVSGNKDLISVGTEYRGVMIVSPAQFLDIL